MPYCEKCGAELGKDEKFCHRCGYPVSEVQMRIKRKSSGVRIVLLVFGSIIILAGFAMLIGGGALLWANTSIVDNEGYIKSRSQQLQSSSYAIAFQHINIHMGEVVGQWGAWRPSPSDFVTIRLTAYSNNPSKNIFIGIARESDVSAYLSNVQYDEVTSLRFLSSRVLEVEYLPYYGSATPSNPASQTFWIASKHGAGTQTLEWAPQTGSYWIVIMNEDGSADVDLTVNVGARVPLLSTIGLSLLIGGIIALVIGLAMILLGSRR